MSFLPQRQWNAGPLGQVAPVGGSTSNEKAQEHEQEHDTSEATVPDPAPKKVAHRKPAPKQIPWRTTMSGASIPKHWTDEAPLPQSTHVAELMDMPAPMQTHVATWDKEKNALLIDRDQKPRETNEVWHDEYGYDSDEYESEVEEAPAKHKMSWRQWLQRALYVICGIAASILILILLEGTMDPSLPPEDVQDVRDRYRLLIFGANVLLTLYLLH